MFDWTRSRQMRAANSVKDDADAIDHRYETAIALWSESQGCEAHDYTVGQLRRFRALEAAGGDDTTARGLLYGRVLHKTGRIQ